MVRCLRKVGPRSKQVHAQREESMQINFDPFDLKTKLTLTVKHQDTDLLVSRQRRLFTSCLCRLDFLVVPALSSIIV